MSKIKNNDLEKYLVQVQGEQLIGSGVLFKYHTKICIFTAKHNFEFSEEGQTELKDIDLEKIKADKKKIKILPYKDIEIKILDVIGLDDTSIDLIILIVDEEKSKGLKNIGNLDIFNREVSDLDKDIKIAGYPSIRVNEKSINIEYFNCSFEASKNNIFEVFSKKVNSLKEKEKRKNIVGISGSGAFVKNNDQLSLIGIEIEHEGLGNLVCINLAKLKEEIDSKLFYSEIDYTYEEFKVKKKNFKFKMIKVNLENESLYISTHPVTFNEYDLFLKDSKQSKSYQQPNDRGWGRGQRPVINVSWRDAKKYCNWLSKKTKKKYRLPSSDEWKNIAKLNYKFCDNNRNQHMWYGGKEETIEVDNQNIKPDILGLYNFYGNVDEWCENGVARGGSFRNTEINKKTKTRHKYPSERIGFRVYRKI